MFTKRDYRREGPMLNVESIWQLFGALHGELKCRNVPGDAYLAGVAVMCLESHSREANKHIDALLVPATELRAATHDIAKSEDHAGYVLPMQCVAMRLGKNSRMYASEAIWKQNPA